MCASNCLMAGEESSKAFCPSIHPSFNPNEMQPLSCFLSPFELSPIKFAVCFLIPALCGTDSIKNIFRLNLGEKDQTALYVLFGIQDSLGLLSRSGSSPLNQDRPETDRIPNVPWSLLSIRFRVAVIIC